MPIRRADRLFDILRILRSAKAAVTAASIADELEVTGYTVVDMDAHIRERVDKFFKDYIDPEWLFASDWPHGDTGWPEGVQQTGSAAPQRQRTEKNPRRERNAPLPAPAQLT